MPDDYRKVLHAEMEELRIEVIRLAAMTGDVIGERVRFMTDGHLPEHAGAARVRARQAMAADVDGPQGERP